MIHHPHNMLLDALFLILLQYRWDNVADMFHMLPGRSTNQFGGEMLLFFFLDCLLSGKQLE